MNQSIFDQFTDQYSVTKTLRFCPQTHWQNRREYKKERIT